MKYFQIILLIFLVSSCHTGDERTKNYYEDGAIKTLGKTENGLKQGEWISFAPNGDTLQIVNFKDNSKHGVFKVFSSDAITSQQYLNDTVGGIFKKWNKQGVLLEESNKIKGGTYHGTAKRYFESGSIREITGWDNGAKVSVKSYHSNGNVIYESANLLNGTARSYDSLGNLKFSIQIKDNETTDTLFKARPITTINQ